MFWTHILCGQVTNAGVAQGFHSQTRTSNWYACVDTDRSCYYYNRGDGNGQCPDVYIYDDEEYYYEKAHGSSVFYYGISATNLVNYLKAIVRECGKKNSFCATGCTNSGYTRSFSIYFQMIPKGVLSAYPKRNCNTNVCASPRACQNMN